MKKYILIARQKTVITSQNNTLGDEALKALDCYWEGPVHEYDDSVHPTVIANKLIEEYEHSPEFMPNCEYELKTVK